MLKVDSVRLTENGNSKFNTWKETLVTSANESIQKKKTQQVKKKNEWMAHERGQQRMPRYGAE